MPVVVVTERRLERGIQTHSAGLGMLKWSCAAVGVVSALVTAGTRHRGRRGLAMAR
jgi:hypothetical protein